MFGICSCQKSSADNVEFSFESSISLNSTFAGIAISWIDDYWLMKCLTAERLACLIPILGVIGSIPKVAGMITEKVTLANGFIQSTLGTDLCLEFKCQWNNRTFESIPMWLFFFSEINWWRTSLFCFCWLWFIQVVKSAQVKKKLSEEAGRLTEQKLSLKLSIFAQNHSDECCPRTKYFT